MEPGEHRANGYEAPSHRWSDAKLRWRELPMSLGRPPAGSFPAEQQAMDLNGEATLSPEQSERHRFYA